MFSFLSRSPYCFFFTFNSFLYNSTLQTSLRFYCDPKEKEEIVFTERFVRGSGKGGQKINKTSSAVCLVEEKYGIVVKCQQTRSREQNRKIARKILLEKIDALKNGTSSKKQQKIDKIRRRKAKARQRSSDKYSETNSDEDFDEVESKDFQETDIDDIKEKSIVEFASSTQYKE